MGRDGGKLDRDIADSSSFRLLDALDSLVRRIRPATCARVIGFH